jgi:hypothetical protein
MTTIAPEEAEIETAQTEGTEPEPTPGPEPGSDSSTDSDTNTDTNTVIPPQTRSESAADSTDTPEPRASASQTADSTGEPEPEAERGKAKRARKAVRGKSAGGTKTLVVWREGRVQYADDNVLVVDLDEAASPDTDVHDVVDRLTELREALDSPGRTDAVAALAEIIQDKALS